MNSSSNTTHTNSNFTLMDEAATGRSFQELVQAQLSYKIGEAVNEYYFPFFVPFGVLGNILSFLVMIQKQNRQMSFSLYICVLAVTDTLSLMLGFSRYLHMMGVVEFISNALWHCILASSTLFISNMCSTLFILAMTFERFYSIIRPHKAASFNTVKRAKITIIFCIVFSIIYNSPHLFITGVQTGHTCDPYGKAIDKTIGQVYYWANFVTSFVLPFILLLSMNSVIIHTLRTRSMPANSLPQGQGQSQGQSEGHTQTAKRSDQQIFIILFLVTFTFLILTTPTWVFLLYARFIGVGSSPKSMADFHLLYSMTQKLYYANNGINFYLYVISGRKFRTDLMRLLRIKSCAKNELSSKTNSLQSQTATTET